MSDFTSLSGKSWTAYVKIGLVGLFFLAAVTPGVWSASWKFGLAALLASIVFVGYKVLFLRSVHLYCDGEGIWLYSGILPWNKSLYGIKWRDFGGATYIPAMGSWFSKSYSIRINHRFTASNVLYLTEMAHGDAAISEINAQHQEMIEAKSLN